MGVHPSPADRCAVLWVSPMQLAMLQDLGERVVQWFSSPECQDFRSVHRDSNGQTPSPRPLNEVEPLRVGPGGTDFKKLLGDSNEQPEWRTPILGPFVLHTGTPQLSHAASWVENQVP